jgi:hypothetical protein
MEAHQFQKNCRVSFRCEPIKRRTAVPYVSFWQRFRWSQP